MKRFISLEIEGKIEAYSEADDWQTAAAHADEFVWQFAPDAETAIRQHDEKFSQWQSDNDAGGPTKDTY